MNGVFLNEGEQIGIVDPVSGTELLDQVEDERQFDASEVEEKVTVLLSLRDPGHLQSLRRWLDGGAPRISHLSSSAHC